MISKNKYFSLHKSRKILKHSYDCYKKNWKNLENEGLNEFEKTLETLNAAVIAGNRVEADLLAKKAETFTALYCKKSIGDYVKEFIIAIIIALFIAILVRQVWFELYEIPTGSMRPTFKEKDHLLVSKTTFGINYPLKTEHLYFDPKLVQRGSALIFSGDGIDLPDTDTTYFGIFPYKKRYVKRTIGLPGDSLYFYGGKIYGVDKEGNEITDLLGHWLNNLDHIPFISFEGKLSAASSDNNGNVNQIIFLQMNKPIGRLLLKPQGEVSGEIFNGTSWVKDKPQGESSTEVQTISDFWGMRNFGMARLLTKSQVEKFSKIPTTNLKDAPLYLEIRHTPNLTNPKPQFIRDSYDHFNLLLTPFITVIPLEKSHLKSIMDNMYTARFIVENGRARRYSAESENFGSSSPRYSGIPDGTYEFYYGKAYKVLWGGITELLPDNHPLYSLDPKNVQWLYNLGIEVRTSFEPHSLTQLHYPSRYAYFRDGDLYSMDNWIIKKDDQTLIDFNEQEKARAGNSTEESPYIAFKDYGAPLKDGKIDKEFIKTYGITVPDKHYLVLGDNYAMSSDSRYFGMVHENNLQGSPSYILWPPGSRWGIPNQKPYPWVTFPRLVIWGIALAILVVWLIARQMMLKRPVYKKLS